MSGAAFDTGLWLSALPLLLSAAAITWLLSLPMRNVGLVDPLWTDGGFLLALERYGYDVRDSLAAIVAFQRRFRPELIDGEIDGECRAILLQLLPDPERAHTA